MARRIVPIGKDNLKDLPLPCRNCFFWESTERISSPLVARGGFEQKTKWFEDTLNKWGVCGKLLYDNRETLAYVQFAPLPYLPQCNNFPAGPVSEDAIVFSCLYVIPEMRGRGLGKVLLQSALKSLFKKRFKTVESFASRLDPHELAVPLDFYLKNGFYVLRDDHKLPLVRLDLRAAVTWQVNIQTMLDSIKIPVRVPATSS